MENDSQAIAIGLGAGLGGFAAFVIIACIVWHCVCGSLCEKKKDRSATIPIALKDHRKIKNESLNQSHKIFKQSLKKREEEYYDIKCFSERYQIKSNYTIIKLNELIDISLRLYLNCFLIKPQDQTITEIKTLCNNNQPNILTNGGIEVLFQCQFNLCEIYQICFVGEIGFKLPTTNIECFSIEVTVSKNECTKAANEYDFNTPRNRYFIKAESIDVKSQSRRWLWIFFAHLVFLLAGIITYCSCKQMLLLFYNRSFRKQFKRKRIRTVIELYPIVVHRNTKLTEPLLPKHEHVLSKKEKVRTQYLRLGSVDHPNK